MLLRETRYFVLTITLLLVPGYLFGAPPAAAPPKVPAGQVLKDAFAKSALRVLRMIDAETSPARLSQSQTILVPHATNEALNNLDADAETKQDRAVVASLNTYFMAKVMHNLTIETIASGVETALVLAARDSNPIRVSELVATSPTLKLIKAKEAACSTKMEDALRARRYHDIPDCTEPALTVNTPAKSDVILP